MSLTAKWREIPKEELEKIVVESTSFAQVGAAMGYSGGSATRCAKEMIEYYNFDNSHFLGQGHNKGNFDYSRFRYGNNIKAANMLDALVELRGHQCEECKLTEWNNHKIPLEVHHIDGDKINNNLENLQLLCPNCHALTENWRGKNINKKENVPIDDEKFVQALKENKNVRQALLSLGLSAAGGNYQRAYDLAVKYDIQHILKK